MVTIGLTHMLILLYLGAHTITPMLAMQSLGNYREYYSGLTPYEQIMYWLCYCHVLKQSDKLQLDIYALVRRSKQSENIGSYNTSYLWAPLSWNVLQHGNTLAKGILSERETFT